jgi:thioredoxin-related protein
LHKNIAALTFGCLLLLSSPAWSSDGWIEDFDAAVKLAKEQKKDLFVDFTGSDWCGWCIKLHDEVFKYEEFTAAVTKDFVLVSLDFPKKEENIARVPNMARNRELQKKYGIQGFPTILLMNNDGVVYAQTGYEKGGATAYVEHIKELRGKGRVKLTQVQVVLDAFNAADAAAKTEALDKLLATLTTLGPESPFAQMLLEPARSAFDLDPKNEKGLKLRAVQVLSKAGQYDEKLLAAAKEVDPANTVGARENAVRAMFSQVNDEAKARASLKELDALNALAFKDAEIGFELNFTAANWCAGPMSDPTTAKTYAALAKKIGTDDARQSKVLEDILGQPEDGGR